MADFGDFEADDSFSLGDADPDAVTLILLMLLVEEKGDLRRAVVRLLARLRREGTG